MRMTSKGQVTIPKDLRDKLGIKPGSEVGFAEENGKILLFSRDQEDKGADARRMIERLREFGRTAKRIPMTDKELMELTRGPFNDLDPD
jgi:AbrB family looped-hinge helix DNA binding protein